MGAVVTAACVIAKREDGSDAYFYQGVELPEAGLKEGEVDRLVELELVERVGGDDEGDKPRRGRRSASD